MPPTTETEMKELRELVIGLREELRVGFVELKAEITAEIKRVETKTDIKFAELTGKIDVIDERTKLGFWGFVGRALIISSFGLAVSLAVKYFFFGTLRP